MQAVIDTKLCCIGANTLCRNARVALPLTENTPVHLLSGPELKEMILSLALSSRIPMVETINAKGTLLPNRSLVSMTANPWDGWGRMPLGDVTTYVRIQSTRTLFGLNPHQTTRLWRSTHFPHSLEKPTDVIIIIQNAWREWPFPYFLVSLPANKN